MIAVAICSFRLLVKGELPGMFLYELQRPIYRAHHSTWYSRLLWLLGETRSSRYACCSLDSGVSCGIFNFLQSTTHKLLCRCRAGFGTSFFAQFIVVAVACSAAQNDLHTSHIQRNIHRKLRWNNGCSLSLSSDYVRKVPSL